MAKYKNNKRDWVLVFKALSDWSRVRAWMALCEGELCVCQVIELLGLAPSTVSKHMSVLKHAGLVASRKEGRWIYYRLAMEEDAGARSLLETLARNMSEEETLSEDRARIRDIRKREPEELCRKQACKGRGKG